MAIVANTGLFGSMTANQSKLNSRKNKRFLWNGISRRFHKKDISIRHKEMSKSQKKRLLMYLKDENRMERQKDLLMLIISVLIVSLASLVVL